MNRITRRTNEQKAAAGIAQLLERVKADKNDFQAQSEMHRALEGDDGAVFSKVLEEAKTEAEPSVRKFVVFALARIFAAKGDGAAIRRLYRAGDDLERAAVLNGICEPKEGAIEAALELSMEGMIDGCAEIRAEACRVAMNLAAARVKADATAAHLPRLVADEDRSRRCHGARVAS